MMAFEYCDFNNRLSHVEGDSRGQGGKECQQAEDEDSNEIIETFYGGDDQT